MGRLHGVDTVVTGVDNDEVVGRVMHVWGWVRLGCDALYCG